MTIHYHHSTDHGLLDHIVEEFKFKHPNTLHLRRPSSADLEMSLIQQSLLSSHENVVIEDYSGPWELLDTMVRYSGSENILIVDEKPPHEAIMGLLDNEDWELKPLNHRTKKSYLKSLLSGKYKDLKLSKYILGEIKKHLPTSASSINELLERIFQLKSIDKLNDRMLVLVLRDVQHEFVFFHFFNLYFSDDLSKWLLFFHGSVTGDLTFKQFSYALSYKLLELKKYLSASKCFSRDQDVLKYTRIAPFELPYYKDLTKKFCNLIGWVDSFIIDLYKIHFVVVYSSECNISLLKYFLLRKHEELLAIRRTND